MAFGKPFPGVDSSGYQDPNAHKFEVYTTAQRNALVGKPAGYTVFDSTLNYLVTWNGTNWRNGAGTAV